MAGRSCVQIEIHSRTACIVTLHGEHDLASSEQVTLALALARSYSNVLVDLTACSFLDVKIANALLEAARGLRQADHSLILIVPPTAGAARRLLDHAGVVRIAPVHATRSAALAAIAPAELRRPDPGEHDLRLTRAQIARTEASRSRRVAKTRRATTVLRAVVTESVETERPQAA